MKQGGHPQHHQGARGEARGLHKGASQHFESHLKACQQSLAHPSSPCPLALGAYQAEFWDNTNEETIGFLRHAEIKHGRIAMAGFVGFMAAANYETVGAPMASSMYAPLPSGLSAPEVWDAIPEIAKSSPQYVDALKAAKLGGNRECIELMSRAFERAEAELLQRPGDCADLMYAHVHEEVNVTRRARWVHTGTDRMRVDHQPADENPRFRVGGIRDFEYEVPRVDVVRDDDQVFRVSHSALIWSRARTPALCTRVGAARAQSTATSALCAIPVETHVLLPELGV